MRENVRRAFWAISIKSDEEDQGWIIVDRCVRAGLLLRVGDRWQFANDDIECFLVAEFVYGGNRWASLLPQHRRHKQWLAAILARRGSPAQVQVFFEQMALAQRNVHKISVIDFANILTEFNGVQSPVLSSQRTEVEQRLKELAQTDSNLVRLTVKECANKLGINVGPANFNAAPEIVFGPEVIEQSLPNLHRLQRELEIPTPVGEQADRLRDTLVVAGLIDTLPTTQQPNLKLRCADWLRRAPLSKVKVSVRFGHDRPQRLVALEVIAQIALDPNPGDEITHIIARSVLTTSAHLSELVGRSDKFQPLVYTILLALDKRLYYRKEAGQWEFLE